MPKKPTIQQYERKLKALIARRTGQEAEPWMEMGVHTAAQCLVMIDRVHEELTQSWLGAMETGSQGQAKQTANPLLPVYKDLQRTMIMHYEMLGLSYKNDPTRISRPAKAEGAGDSVTDFMSAISGDNNTPESL